MSASNPTRPTPLASAHSRGTRHPGPGTQRFWPHPRRMIELGPHGGAHRVAVRAGLAIAVPLGVLAATGHIDLALYAVFGAFTALYGRSHSHVTRLRMQATAGAGLVLAVVLGTAVSVSPARDWLALPVVAVIAAGATFAGDALGWHPPGALFFVFALTACAAVPSDPGRVVVALVLAAGSAALAIAISTVGLALPSARRRERTHLATKFAATTRSRAEYLKVLTLVVAVVAAGLIPTATGIGHPYWAMVSATAALGAADTTGHLVRAGQRVLGTFIGLALAALLLAVSAGQIELIVIIVLLQVGAELFVMRNYGVTMIFVTPLALLMTQLAHPVDEAGLLRDRALETVLGAAVGIAVSAIAFALSRRFTGTAPAGHAEAPVTESEPPATSAPAAAASPPAPSRDREAAGAADAAARTSRGRP